MWSVGDSITTMDSLAFPDGGIIFAFGSAKGRILLRFDWEEIPKSFECEKAVTDIKFSSDAAYLVAASESQQLLVFTYNNNSYFHFSPKEYPKHLTQAAFRARIPYRHQLLRRQQTHDRRNKPKEPVQDRPPRNEEQNHRPRVRQI